MNDEQYRASVDKRLDDLRQLILSQVKEIYDSLTNIKAELRDVRLRNEKLESNRRRL